VKIIAMVASAGGFQALQKVLVELPGDLPAAVILAQHLSGQGSMLAELLQRYCALEVSWIGPETTIEEGRAYICPPQTLVTVQLDGRCELVDVDDEHRFRTLDFLLHSLAPHGKDVIAVVLTGMGHDAAEGAAAVARSGGVLVVQSEDTAQSPSMPHAAIATGLATAVVPLSDVASTITRLVSPVGRAG
jgi:chemotaxis response regulator CheB